MSTSQVPDRDAAFSNLNIQSILSVGDTIAVGNKLVSNLVQANTVVADAVTGNTGLFGSLVANDITADTITATTINGSSSMQNINASTISVSNSLSVGSSSSKKLFQLQTDNIAQFPAEYQNTNASLGVQLFVVYPYVFVAGDSNNNIQFFPTSVREALLIYDLRATPSPSLVSLTSFTPVVLGFIQILSNHFAYITSSSPSCQIQIVDVSTPNTPVVQPPFTIAGETECTIFLSTATNVLVAYFANNNHLKLFSVSSPTTPVQQSSISPTVHPIAMALENSLLYLIDTAGNLQIYDISNPTAPLSLFFGALFFPVVSMNNSAASISVYQKNLFVQTGEFYLLAANAQNSAAPVLLNPNNPFYLGNVAQNYSSNNTQAMINNFLVLFNTLTTRGSDSTSSNSAILIIVDTTNPSSLVIAQQYVSLPITFQDPFMLTTFFSSSSNVPSFALASPSAFMWAQQVQLPIVLSNNNVYVPGNLSVGGAKMFAISHPLSPSSSSKLQHACIEAPRNEVLYRGHLVLDETKNKALVDIDASAKMRSGTFAAFTRNAQLFVFMNYLHYLQEEEETKVFASDHDFSEELKGEEEEEKKKKETEQEKETREQAAIESGRFWIQLKSSKKRRRVDWLVMAERKDLPALVVEVTQ